MQFPGKKKKKGDEVKFWNIRSAKYLIKRKNPMTPNKTPSKTININTPKYQASYKLYQGAYLPSMQRDRNTHL